MKQMIKQHIDRLILDVFAPQAGERVTIMADRPRDGMVLTAEWDDRLKMAEEGKIAYLHVEENRIVDVSGDDPITWEMRQYFSCDRGRQNIAELGLGCNEYAVVTGNVLEDEKVGPHIAYGRSDHLGGIVGPEQFDDPRHVVHHDTVYAKGCTIETRSLVLEYANEVEEEILRDGKYLLF